MVIMTGNGTLAGTLSPFAPTGIVAHGVMQRIGLGGVEWQTFAYNALAHTLVGVGGFLLLGGWRLFRTTAPGGMARRRRQRRCGRGCADFRGRGGRRCPRRTIRAAHWLTTAGIAALICAVAGFEINVGMAALIIATLLDRCCAPSRNGARSRTCRGA